MRVWAGVGAFCASLPAAAIPVDASTERAGASDCASDITGIEGTSGASARPLAPIAGVASFEALACTVSVAMGPRTAARSRDT